jgi:hypothetical protein
MEGTPRKRRQTPQVLRSFAPTRLADDVLAGVYQRLLSVHDRLAALEVEFKDKELLAGFAQGQLVATGGQR